VRELGLAIFEDGCSLRRELDLAIFEDGCSLRRIFVDLTIFEKGGAG